VPCQELTHVQSTGVKRGAALISNMKSKNKERSRSISDVVRGRRQDGRRRRSGVRPHDVAMMSVACEISIKFWLKITLVQGRATAKMTPRSVPETSSVAVAQCS
jgi:hypothetical protein